MPRLIKRLMFFVKYLINVVIYKAMWVFPVVENCILFQSYEEANGFTDNPKYLCKYLHEEYKNRFKYIFVINKNVKDSDIDYIKTVSRRSFRKMYYMATSKVLVFNVRTPVWLSRRKGQLVINTWHGGGAFKRTGIHEDAGLSDWLEKRIRNYINLFVSSSRVFTESNIIEGMRYTGEILPCGMPRNDLFFSPKAVAYYSAEIRKQYGFGDALCVLFAPTFRGNGDTRINSFPPLREVAETLKKKTGKDVVILVRKHRRDINHYDIPGVTFDVGGYPDPQELLCSADILITDYSSTMWDFALLGRPCFLFVPDLAEYDKDRGFFTPIEEWPGILCHNRDELLREMKELDPERSRNIAEQYLEKAGSYEKGTAARAIAGYIYRNTIGMEKE